MYGIVRKPLLYYVKRDKYLLILTFPLVLYFFIFDYIPMAGIVIGFQNFIPGKGVFGSPWVGFKWFEHFFSSIFFFRVMRNTLLLSFYSLIFGFPVPILFALLLNEAKVKPFKRVVQTISYFPHFIAIVVIVGLLFTMLDPKTGVVNQLIAKMGGDTINFMNSAVWFRPLYVISGIWQQFGYSAIIYLAVLSSINPELYESAIVDGANRWQQMLHITLPGMAPTIIILLILQVGRLLTVGFQKVLLMYSPAIYETADVLQTYVYRSGIVNAQYGYGTAVGFFNALVNFLFLVAANKLSKTFSETSLW